MELNEIWLIMTFSLVMKHFPWFGAIAPSLPIKGGKNRKWLLVVDSGKDGV